MFGIDSLKSQVVLLEVKIDLLKESVDKLLKAAEMVNKMPDVYDSPFYDAKEGLFHYKNRKGKKDKE